MEQTREASYAENLLYHAGFEFQPRNPGERLNIARIADADVGRIVREVDIEALSSFLEEITYCELTDDDLYQYSDESLLKLFQLMQLTIEYLVDAQDTLSANLNGLAKKYAAKKREHSTLAKALAANDVLMAELKDELHYHRQFVNSSVASGGKAVTRVDPSDFPSQEGRPTASDPASLEEISSGSSATTSRKDDGTIRLHLVSSTHALYLQLDVQDSLTVHNLQNKIAGRLLEAGNYVSFDFDKFTLFHKDEALIETSKSLRECGIVNYSALVILPRPVKEAPDTTPENAQVEPRLKELTLLATKSHEKLAQAIRTMESTQESSTAALAKAITTQMKSLERALREEIQRRVTDSRPGPSLQQQTAPRLADVQSPLSKLNIGELVETDGGEIEEESDTKQGSTSNEGTSSELEDTKMPSDDAKEEQPKVDTTVGVAFKVDTGAEVFDREVSPFNPPSEIEVTSDMTEDSPHEATTNGDTDESGTLSSSRSSSSMHYSASSTQLVRSVISTRTPTPTKGFLDRYIPPPEEAPATSSPYLYREAADSSKADHLHARKFRFSDASLKGLISCPDDYNTSLCDPETAPQISQGRPASAASDLQSIEVPANVQVAGDGPDLKPAEKKKGRFGLKKRPSFKLPKWKKNAKGEHAEI